MAFWKVYGDGCEIDILYASSIEDAIEQAKVKYGTAVWTARLY